MHNVEPLRAKDITPKMVLHNAMKESHKYNHCLVIMMNDEENFCIRSTHIDNREASYICKVVEMLTMDQIKDSLAFYPKEK